ncbi:iojap family protein [Thermosipho africanus H17ap60334]|uniref:ribosome silencing factor n=1 Tax=Thermosipho TaxID=2420 RepID=UPI00028E1103|nr:MULTISPECIES: ribosome silencing factor [Thermosipho]EKF49204.1 iojap family protein [Thermosipho africanus H17ap60334]MBZ4650553.1 iojap family protein [Thermosipho sp. (in: thermotogales)]MDK2839441.1 ribosome-associated protein [Thermosipho sp. (in: thermotogales)]RDI91049.1 iojap family protein [Thermosipho africanus Ob7]
MEILELIWKKILEKEAIEPVILDMSNTNVPTDYFIILTANSNTHMNSLRDTILDLLSEIGKQVIYYDKEDNHEWLIIDASDIVIHIFTKEAREFYDLEGLWIDAKKIKGEK